MYRKCHIETLPLQRNGSSSITEIGRVGQQHDPNPKDRTILHCSKFDGFFPAGVFAIQVSSTYCTFYSTHVQRYWSSHPLYFNPIQSNPIQQLDNGHIETRFPPQGFLLVKRQAKPSNDLRMLRVGLSSNRIQQSHNEHTSMAFFPLVRGGSGEGGGFAVKERSSISTFKSLQDHLDRSTHAMTFCSANSTSGVQCPVLVSRRHGSGQPNSASSHRSNSTISP
jgi:hypothetical protein